MFYPFYCSNELCPNEGETIEIEMKASEYTDKQYCPVCGDKMHRTVASLVCGYSNDKDFCGKCH